MKHGIMHKATDWTFMTLKGIIPFIFLGSA